MLKSSEDLERGELGVIVPNLILSGMSERDNAESFARDGGNLELRSHKSIIQVVVVFVMITNVSVYECSAPSFATSMTHELRGDSQDLHLLTSMSSSLA